MDRSTPQAGHRMGLAKNTATTLLALNGLDVSPKSAVSVEDTQVGLIWSDQNVAVLAPSRSRVLSGFEGESSAAGDRTLVLGPMNATNLDALRTLLPWLRPRPLGPSTSAGFGDRLGLATPGHVRALRAAGGELAPIFAQQSIREMERTGRSPQEVLDDATWGVFAEGWQEGFGADADHLKTTEDVDACVAAGYTFFTFDPGEYVDDGAEAAGASALRAALEDLPWQDLEDLPADMKRRYLGSGLKAEGHEVRFDNVSLARAAFKYGAAVAHVARLYPHLKTAGTSYLVALRTVAALNPDLFREIYDFSRGRYEEDRATYHVSASLERAVQPRDMPDGELPALLERFDEREILHVTFGSVLKEARFRDRLLGLVRDHPDHYAAGLEEHFLRHLEPFANGGCK